MKQEKIWSKDFTLLTLGNFSNAVVFYLLMTSIAVFAETQFHTSQKLAGLAVSIFLIGSLLSRVFAGKYMDVYGRKKCMLAAQVLNILVMVAYFLVNGIEMLIAIRIIHGFSFGFNSTLFLTCAMATLPEGRHGEGNGYFSLSVASGMAVGPLLAIQVVTHFGYSALFMICVVGTCLTMLCTLLAHVIEIGPDPGRGRGRGTSTVSGEHLPDGEAPKKEFFLWTVLAKHAIPVSLVMFVGGIGFSGILSFTNAYTLNIGLPDVGALYFMVYAICLFVSRPLSGRIYDRHGENIVVLPAITLFGVCYALMAASENWIVFMVSAACLAFGYGTLMSILQVLAVRVSPERHMGLAIATFYICLDIGTGLGGYLVGGLIDWVGFRAMYLVVAGLLFCMIPVFWFIHGRKVRREKLHA